ncbi:MAG: IMPACT family protein [Clostridiales bacterium]|jgi:uncharacterized YigZ family protein|nr:IMPACT family protein [Clostridiales bacterium]
MEPYTTIAAPAAFELVEKKSRFIAEARPVADREAFAAFLAEIRARHYKARHNTYAYALRGEFKYSDDGEPQGTAGFPIHGVIKARGLSNVAVIVTRYFGGVLLGAPGLVRAYSAAAAGALSSSSVVTQRPHTVAEISVAYDMYDKVRRETLRRGVLILGSDFAASVVIHAAAPEGFDAYATALNELTGGAIHVNIIGVEYIDD